MAMSSPDLFLSSVLNDRYYIQRRLGSKVGRRTFLAFDHQTQQPVIVKVLSFSQDWDWEEFRLFQREAELLQTLSHPSIPQYIDAFEFETAASKGYVLVQSYVDAPSLQDHLKAGRCFNEDDVRDILDAVLKILIYLHQRQPPVIHRDIKPSNILLGDRSGNCPGQVYLVDFGSVQTLANRGGKTVTVVGTYGYMPPEQFGGVACPASDLYSLGATAITLLTQTHPADLPKEGVWIRFEERVSLRPSFQTWLQQMIAPAIAERPASAQAALISLTYSHLFQMSMPSQPSRAKPTGISTVTSTQLLVDATQRSVLWGAFLGVFCISIFPGLLIPTVILMLAPYGAMSGAFLGGINGVLIGILTRLFYFPLNRFAAHCMTCTVISILTGLAASLSTLAAFTGWDTPMVSGFAGLLAPAFVLNGALMGIPSYKIISRWYQWSPNTLASPDGKPPKSR